MYYGDIEPDLAGAMKLGIRGTYLKPGQEAPADGEWGAIAAWAWGLSRMADYLETDTDVDARRLAARRPLAAGQDGALGGRDGHAIRHRHLERLGRRRRRDQPPRVRRNGGRSQQPLPALVLRQLQDSTAAAKSEMPFDAHMLLALIAPRPLYVASADEDQWADPKGEFLAAVAASDVYERLGRKGVGTTAMPPVNQPVGDTVRYHVRTGKHDITAYDWQQYLDFAEKHFPAMR